MDIYHYPVVDCEHEGDMRSAEFEVTDAGAKVIDTYWDGEDCGDAYIEFTCAPENAEVICDKLGYKVDMLFSNTRKD